MKWKASALEGWHDGYAWTPTLMMDGHVIWLEPYRYYVNNFGAITTIYAVTK